MRNLTIYAFMLVMLFWVAGNNALAAQETSESNYLPIHTSLIPLLNWSGGAGFPPRIFPANRINPAAKGHIHYCFSDEYAKKINADVLNTRLGGIWLLGFIGNKDDIQFVDHFLQDSLTSKEFDFSQLDHLAFASGCFSGMMLRRGIEGAENFFEKYAKLSSWMPTDENEMSLILSSVQNAYNGFLYNSYLYSRSAIVLPYLTQSTDDNPPLRKDLVDSLLRTDVDFYTEYMKPTTLSQQELDSLFGVFLEERGGWVVIDAIINKDVIKIPGNAAADSKPQKETMESVSEAITLTDPNQIGCLESAATQAVKAYLRVSGEIAAGIYNDLHTKLLDNGRLISLEKLIKGGDSLSKALGKEREILEQVRKAGLNSFSDFEVKIEIQAALGGFLPDTGDREADRTGIFQKTEVKGNESATVTFIIPGTAEIYQKYNPGGDTLTTCKSGDLKVYMKRIDGRWYWNPFGW